MQRILFSIIIFFFAAPSFAQKSVEAEALVKEKTELLQAADRLNFTDYKVCYEIGLLTERAYAFAAIALAPRDEKTNSNTELSLSDSLRIKFTKLVSELEGFCSHDLDDRSLNEGDRPELFKRLSQISELRLALLKESAKN